MFFNPNQAVFSVVIFVLGIITGAGAFYLISSGFIGSTSIMIGILIGFLAAVFLSVILNPYL